MLNHRDNMRLAIFYFLTLLHLNLVSRNDARLVQSKKNIKEHDEINQTTVNYHKVRLAHDNSEHKPHYLDNYGSIQVVPVRGDNVRTRRLASQQNGKDSREKTVNNNNSKPQSKQLFINKPIPPYNAKYTEDDDGSEVNDSKISRMYDSFEHEDEDFSLNDYDFDTTHDEFGGKEKLQVPIIKKSSKESDRRVQSFSAQANIHPTSKEAKEAKPLKQIPPSTEGKKANVPLKLKSKSEEYYDDASTKKPIKEDKSSTQDSSAAVDDSKEVKRPIRTITIHCEKEEKKRWLNEGKTPFPNVLTLFPYIRH